MARRLISDLWGQREQLFPNVLGVGALFSGAALVVHILTGFSLRYGLALTASTLACGVLAVGLRLAPGKRRQLLWIMGVGAGAGVLATVTYDATKFVLSQLDPSPYNPFALTHTFGVLLVGTSAPPALVYASGIGFHILNGISFAVAFCFLFGRRGILAGVAWGVFLELFQLTLYPGWLDIRFYREFAAIGSLSHLVYGAVLGTCCRAGLRQLMRRYGSSPRLTS